MFPLPGVDSPRDCGGAEQLFLPELPEGAEGITRIREALEAQKASAPAINQDRSEQSENSCVDETGGCAYG